MIPFSVLDLSPITVGATASDALRNSLDLARHAEKWGYHRYWLAEHHNMPGIASSATAVVIAHVAGGTKSIRVGSGGVMLPNHSPLVIAEQFGTLASLYPGRIDLGLGRAPGTDVITTAALRRDIGASANRFPRDVQELMAYFEPVVLGQTVRAVPGAGLHVPVWLLGSSLYSAELAAVLGLPFAFASHFAPDEMMAALDLYRSRFEPSAQLEKPYAMLGANVFAAETDADATWHFSSVQQAIVNLHRGNPGQVPPPVDVGTLDWSPREQAVAERMLRYSFVGAPAMVETGLRDFIARTQADELMVAGHFYDHAARLRSFKIASEVRDRLNADVEQATATEPAVK